MCIFAEGFNINGCSLTRCSIGFPAVERRIGYFLLFDARSLICNFQLVSTSSLEELNRNRMQARLQGYGFDLCAAFYIRTYNSKGSRVKESEKHYAQTQARLAEKLFAVGKYYEGKKKPGSALLSYKHILDDYPDTKIAKKADERFEIVRIQYEEIKRLQAELEEKGGKK